MTNSAALPPRIRAFVAVRVGDEVERAIADFIEEIGSPNDGIAWARRDKLHVTLKFLGAAIDAEKIAPLADSLARIAAGTRAMQVSTRGVGGFPDLRRPRVLWVGLESEALIHLAEEVEAAASAGFGKSDRLWAPHLTIGRVRDPRRARTTLERLRGASGGVFGESRIEEMSLYRSHLSSDGSVYEKLASFPLSGCGSSRE